ncbi:MAG: serine/threonine protein kinase, partial [Pseudonocardia sp.]|nr:serine/threonine protein kinase [Pseudonocardia sp.]
MRPTGILCWAMTLTPDASPLVLAERYRLDERVGAGSMGTVWRATDELLGRTVAVKQLLFLPGAPGFDTLGYEEAKQRILREGRLAARLQHPHTIAVFDVVLHDDAPWLVMEYMPSRTLSALLLSEAPVDPLRIAAIGWQIADGLAAAHAAGIVHRDIKPANVLIGDDSKVKITDFGVSRAADDVQLTRTGMIAGTPAYLAPEIARGQAPTPASDVFALGSTLYTAVEGEPPFGLDDNAFALLYKVGRGDVRRPERAGPLTDTLMRMLRKDPAERPTAARARDELAALVSGESQDELLAGRSRPVGPSVTRPAKGSKAKGPGKRVKGSPRPSRTPLGGPPPEPPDGRLPGAAGDTKVDLSAPPATLSA